MHFTTTPNGTRGARQPSAGRLMRWFNNWNAKKIRREGTFAGFTALMLTTIGAKSGAERTTPVAWFPADDDDSWLIIAAAAGAANNPAWYYNIAAHPDDVVIEVVGSTIPVTAEQLRGAEREQAWQRMSTAAPRLASYAAKTDRELPIIKLTRRAG